MQAIGRTCIILALSLGLAGARPVSGDEVSPDESLFPLAEPDELQVSDSRMTDWREEALAADLAGANPERRLRAAQRLWRGHNRRHAVAVLKFLAGPPQGGDAFRSLQREVDDALRPQAILGQLRGGDYAWGAWLAFLRPHKDLVPTLLAALMEKEKEHRLATILALGNSGDPRVLSALIEQLNGGDYFSEAVAASALGYFGGPEVERPLIEALAGDSPLRKAFACEALGKVGSRSAVPALQKLADDKEYTGAVDVSGTAGRAVAAINARTPARAR